jgi:hypothetical protein
VVDFQLHAPAALPSGKLTAHIMEEVFV